MRVLSLVLSLSLLCLSAQGCGDSEAPRGASTGRQAVTMLSEESRNVSLVAHVNGHAAAGYSSIWGYTAPDGREYALLGVRTGTSIVDITQPGPVREVAFIAGPQSSWRELKAYQSYAYIVTEAGGGIQILDLSNLPASVSLAATYTGIDRAHDVTIDAAQGILYTAGGEVRSAKAFSLADPLNPTPMQVIDSPRYVHDLSVQGTRGFFAEGSNGSFAIFDLADLINPKLLARWSPSAAGYAHNIWASADGSSVLTTEENAGKTVKRWDISNLSNIRLTGEYLGPNGLAHNVHVKGDYAYLSHYRSGLRVLDLRDPARLIEVAHYQRAGKSSDSGAWGVYPYFASGNVVVSDIETGLYVLYFAGAKE